MSALTSCWCAPRIEPGGTCPVAVFGAAGARGGDWSHRVGAASRRLYMRHLGRTSDRIYFFELRLVELPKLRLDNREVTEARLTSPFELRNMAPTGLVAAYLARRQSLGCHPEPT